MIASILNGDSEVSELSKGRASRTVRHALPHLVLRSFGVLLYQPGRLRPRIGGVIVTMVLRCHRAIRPNGLHHSQ